MFIIRNSDGSLKFAITQDYIMEGSNDVNFIDFAIEGRDNSTWTADCLFGLPNGSTVTLAGVARDIKYSGITYSGYRVYLKSSVTIYAGTLSITARQYDSSGAILYSYPYSQTVNATTLPDDWEAPITQAQYNSFMALLTSYINAYDIHLVRKYENITQANNDIANISLNEVILAKLDNGTYQLYKKTDTATLTINHFSDYQTCIDSIIENIENTLLNGVLTTKLTKQDATTLTSSIDLTTAFYLKSLVYNKTEIDRDFLTKNDATNTYETKTDFTTHLDTLNDKNTSQDTAITAAQDKANAAYTLAGSKAKGVSFDTYALMTAALASASATDYAVGDSLFIKELNVPDYWVTKVNSTQSGDYGYYEISVLESDMEGYQKIIDNTLTTTSKKIPDAINENKASIGTLTETVDTNIAQLDTKQNTINITDNTNGNTYTFNNIIVLRQDSYDNLATKDNGTKYIIKDSVASYLGTIQESGVPIMTAGTYYTSKSALLSDYPTTTTKINETIGLNYDVGTNDDLAPFYGYTNLTYIKDIVLGDNFTNCFYMFRECTELTSVPLFDTSNVTNISFMFFSCSSLTSVPAFNTSNVTYMYDMFFGCTSLTSVPAFNTSNVTDMRDMFFGCTKLSSILMTGMKVSFNISASTLFTESALTTILNNLATITTTQTLTMGATNLAKLTDADKLIATNKGWTLA